MSERQVFYSFHYAHDKWRVSQVRNIGQIEDNKSVSDDSWAEVKKKGDISIQEWIDVKLQYCSCTIVLIGENTAHRKWIDYEIEKSWNDGKGVVGIHIHKLTNSIGDRSEKGSNPFEHFTIGKDMNKLSSIVKTYNPPYSTTTSAIDYIEKNLEEWIEEAINIRKKYSGEQCVLAIAELV